MDRKHDVVLVDDDELVRRGLCDWLASVEGITVLGEAADANETLSLIENVKPEIALIDVILPGVSGIELTREIRKRFPEVKCIILSGSSDPELVLDAFNSGACGFLPKVVTASELRLAIAQVCEQGYWYLSPSVTQFVLQKALSLRGAPAAGSESAGGRSVELPLSDRERELLKLICEGHTFTEIAEELAINPRSVERLKARLEEKTGAGSLVDLIRRAIKLGLIKP